ncbi:hypothetical protein EJB05_33748, partial [Eragrostis curvula]
MEPAVTVSLGVARSLPAKLGMVLSPEVDHRLRLRKGEKNKIGLLKDHLQQLLDNYLVVEPSEVHASSSTARCWVKEVRELAYDIDDFLDELLHGPQAAAAAPTHLRGGIARLCRGLSRSRWVAGETSRFRAQLEEAIKRHARYNLSTRQSQPPIRICSDEPPIPAPRGFEAARLVGIDGSIEKLAEWLTGDGEERLRVVSIVGLGGVGKTTLARELYRKLGWQFACRAFARSSRKPDMRRLLTSILLQVRPHRLPGDGELSNLIDTIRAYLRHKKYFIIIDDLWASSTWDIVHGALPDDKCCSRVLITTEIDVIAQRCCDNKYEHFFKMEPLSYKGSSELFFSRFVGKQSEKCEEFNRVSSEIIRKCGGFPLATIATASLFARHQDMLEECSYIRGSLSPNLRSNPTIEVMKRVLSLCYNNLPNRLKACMLYLCIYKEDNIIWKDDLVKEWITEGFICAKQGEHIEEVAGSCFDEIVDAGMVLPIDINYNGKVLSCTVHYIILDLIRYKSIEENFVTAIDYSQTNTRLADKVRRLALHFGDADDAESPAKLRLSQVRSLIFTGTFKCLPSLTEFRNLQVLILHLWGDQDNVFLDLTAVCKLFGLRSLKIECNITLNLQTQLQGLKCLETLKIDSKVTEIPQDIVHLPGLLHLSVPGDINLPSGIGSLVSLWTLGCLDLCSNSADNVLSLGKLSNVRDLHLTCSTIPCDNLEENVGCLASALSKLSNLKSLNLSPVVSTNANTMETNASINSISWDGLSNISSPPAFLEKLELSPRLCIFSRLPRWIGQLGKIAVIKIAARELWQSDIDILKRLNALSALKLYVRTNPAERIIFGKEGFPVLNYFKFVCSALCLTFKKETMPSIRRIQLCFSANMLEKCRLVDVGFENLTGLEVFTAKIGGSGSDVSVRNAVQFALEDVFSKRRSCPIINIQLVDTIFYGDKEMSTVDQVEQLQILMKQDSDQVVAKGPSEKQYIITKQDSIEDKTMCGDSRLTPSLECSVYTKNPGESRRKFMQDPFKAPVEFINADQNAAKELILRTNVKVSGREHGLQNAGAKIFTPNPNTVVRSYSGSHQLQGASSYKDLTVEDYNPSLMDHETKGLYFRSRSLEEEILSLRKKVAAASLKELRLLSEKHILEMKLTDLRKAVDEMREEAISGDLKQLKQNKKHLEENKRLKSELKVEEEELNLFTCSMLNMLADYNAHPSQINASTITTCVKHLYQQMQWKIRSLNDHLNDMTQPGNIHATNVQKETPSYNMGANRNTMQPYAKDPSERHAEHHGSRFQQDGVFGATSSNYIEENAVTSDIKLYKLGATMYDYVVTADDVGTLLAVNCTPMDDNGRQVIIDTYKD